MRCVVILVVVLAFLGSCLAFGNVGIDIAGATLQNTTAASVVACASLCDLHSNCVAYSYNTCGSKLCSLKTSADSNLVNSCTTSNAKLGQVGVDRVGPLISGYNPYVLAAGSTAAACASLCEGVSGCVAWSFDNVGGQNCWLSSSIPTKTVNSGRTSGVQGMIGINSPYLGIYTWLLPPNSTATQCSDLCYQTPGCKVWLFEPPTSSCGVKNAGLCWAKSALFYGGQSDACYITGQQAISNATKVTPVITTPATIVAGLPTPHLPFTRMIGFGDNLSDNGNGSYAHCVAAPGQCTNSIYGFRTWTDGPVAISFLSSYLNIPLDVDYAYGHANGGSLFGATVDNNYTASTAKAPSAKDQIANYTSSPGYQTKIAQTLHFLWIGANDINLYHINTNSANNSQFATSFAAQIVLRIQSLVNVGAKYIFLPNLYPKHISPSSTFYASTPAQISNLGAAISQANAAVKSAVAQFGSTVIYYDAYSFLLGVYNNHAQYGISHINGEFCDGYSQLDWELCVTDSLGPTFYWMQYLDMTSNTHNLLAADMYKFLVSVFP